MDPTTIEAYNTHGDAFAQRYRSGKRIPKERLKACFEDRSRILEIGIGSGIDMARLMGAGFDVSGLEPSDRLIQLAETHFPDLAGRIHSGGLPMEEALARNWKGQFDGILCSAVLMHIPDDSQQRALQDMHDVMASDGRLLLTVSKTRDNLDADRRDEFGRYYSNLPGEHVLRLCRNSGFRLIDTWEEEDQYHRRGLSWSTYLLASQVV